MQIVSGWGDFVEVLQTWIRLRNGIWIWIWITCTSNSIVNSSSLKLSLWWRRHDIDRRQPIDFWQAAATSSRSSGTGSRQQAAGSQVSGLWQRLLWAILMTFCQADWRQRVDMRLAHKSSAPKLVCCHILESASESESDSAQLAGIMPRGINNAILNWPSMGQ